MQITRVQVYPSRTGTALATASATIDGGFVVHGIRIYEDHDGRLRIGFPGKPTPVDCPSCGGHSVFLASYCSHCGEKLDRTGEGRHLDTCHPIAPWARALFEDAVLDAYRSREAEGAASRAGLDAGQLARDCSFRV